MKPGYGIVGCGGIARFHFEGLRKAGGAVVHIADVNEAAAMPYVNAFGARYSKDYRDLLADPEVTAVSVLTGSKMHFDICREALLAGKDVICEKTMMECADQAEAIARLVKQSGRLFFTAYMKRFFPAVRKAKELLPLLGKTYSACVRVYQPWGNLFEVEDSRSFDWTLNNYGGAVTKMAGSHMLDMTMNLLGRPSGVYADIDYMPGSRIDRRATAILDYEGGLAVSFEAVTNPHSKVGYERNGWDEHIQINGVKGRLDLYFVKWDQPENNGALLVHYDDENAVSTEYRFAAANPFDREIAYFHSCLQDRIQGNPDVTDGYAVDLLIEAITDSAGKKARVALNWRGL